MHLSLIVSTLLLARCSAGGAQSPPEAVSLLQLDALPSSRYMVVKEGSNTLIECNVTGEPDEVRWFNSKGLLVAGGAGKRRETFDLNMFSFGSCRII